MSQFKLTIDLGNDAMCKPMHVATALKEVAKRVSVYHTKSFNGIIKDINGNTVGSFEYSDD